MKTYIAIAVLGCCSFAAIAFAQKPESASKLTDLLPVGTCVSINERLNTFEIQIVDKESKLERIEDGYVSDFINKLTKQLQELGPAEKLSPDGKKLFEEIVARLAELKVADQIRDKERELLDEFSQTVIYEVISIKSDYLLLKPKKADRDVAWMALPYSAIKQITGSVK